MPESIDLTPSDIHVGLSASFSRDVGEADVIAFAEVTGDANPLHVDAAYAQGTRFARRLVHGAFQVGLASALAGMRLPGRRCLLTSTHARFSAALYFPARVTVRGEIASWNPGTQSGQLRVLVVDEMRGVTTGDIMMGFAFHAAAESVTAAIRSRTATALPADRPLVVVTGASGGIGAALTESLAAALDILAVTNANPLPERLRSPHVAELRLNLAHPGWVEDMGHAIGERPLYAIVHAAWPGMPHGGLLTVPAEALQRQMEFATMHTIDLARLLFGRVSDRGGRIVALGSIAGTRKPTLSAASYSLAKGALERTVQLLAPELARKRITINAICPSFVATGMNRHSDDRARKAEEARVPLGRLCTPQDIAAMVQYLLSEDAEFLSGQSIVLAGGQL